ncbi:hypothetical protein R3I94_000257 [Phoxinus phoxinus]
MASKRYQESGAEKRKKKRQRDDACASLAGSMLKYMQGATQGQEIEPSISSCSQEHQPPTSSDSATAPSKEQCCCAGV